jgi:hypothetical protein
MVRAYASPCPIRFLPCPPFEMGNASSGTPTFSTRLTDFDLQPSYCGRGVHSSMSSPESMNPMSLDIRQESPAFRCRFFRHGASASSTSRDQVEASGFWVLCQGERQGILYPILRRQGRCSRRTVLLSRPYRATIGVHRGHRCCHESWQTRYTDSQRRPTTPRVVEWRVCQMRIVANSRRPPSIGGSFPAEVVCNPRQTLGKGDPQTDRPPASTSTWNRSWTSFRPARAFGRLASARSGAWLARSR